MSKSDDSVTYEVCFVQSGNTVDEATGNLKIAFESMDSNDLHPMWISREECLQINTKEPKLFVMDPFEGELFEHLLQVQCRIVGPLCVLSCLQLSDTLPKRPHPVYSVSMRRMTISCSNLEKECREDISKKIELMGGNFSRDLTKSVTHLVVGEVGSRKYHVAANFGLPIMLPLWVTDVWENQDRQLHASDAYFDKHKCPIFKGLVITVSQLSHEERIALKSIIEANGGKYCGALKARETTHLVLSEPTGEKYRFAKSWKVRCITVNWIHDSIEFGYCRDENLYPLDSSSVTTPKKSTPKKDSSSEFPPVDCSVINNNSILSHLDETTRSEFLMPISTKKNSLTVLETFDVSSLPKYGQFLDGCKIFLTGFNSLQMDKLRKIVNAGGGMRFSKYSDSISHVVCGELSDELMESINSSSMKPHVVNFNWLLDCCRNDKMVDENPFLWIESSLLLSPQKSIQPEAVKDNVNETVKGNMNLLSQTDDMNQENITDIFKQYINEHGSKDEISVAKGNVSNTIVQENSNLKVAEKDDSVVEMQNQDVLMKEPEIMNIKEPEIMNITNDEEKEEEEVVSLEQLFRGKTFVISGFAEKDSEILSDMVETHAGIVSSSDCNYESDIAIVPMIWSDTNLNAVNIVTNCWLQKCIEECQIFEFDSNELFRPMDIDLKCKPLENFVISVSQYGGTERDCLMHLAEVLGAKCQDYFVRRANKSKGVLPNTHLIVATPDGNKYEAAKKWKIPAVSKYWLLDAANLGIVPLEEKYLVKISDAPLENVENLQANKNSNDSGNGHCEEKPTKNEQPISVEVEPNTIEAEINVPQKSNTVLPITASVKRVKELKKSHKNLLNRSVKLDSSSIEQLDLGQPYDMGFNISGLLKDLDSCSSPESVNALKKKHSLPLGELFNKNLSEAIEKFKAPSHTTNGEKLAEGSKNIEENSTSPLKNNVLNGVVVCVARKLANIQSELNEIVASLGGEYQWSYDSKCTHYVFQGKPNDLTKEFRAARSQGKVIVSPEWIYACREENALLEEKLYPHTFKSRMSLTGQISTLKISDKDKSLVAAKKDTESSVPLPDDKVVEPEDPPVDFNRELNDLLAKAKSAKRSNSKRRGSSVSSSPVCDVATYPKRTFSDTHKKHYCENKKDNLAPEEQDVCSQPSQTYPITWDDPTGRLEREKIAAKLATNKLSNEKTGEIGQDEASSSKAIPLKYKVPKFMLTGFSDSEKAKHTSTILRLGGECVGEKSFDISATHLIIDKLLKNEKFLCSVASGKWILHSSYLTASVKNENFLPEDLFEWGGISTNQFLRDPNPNTLKIAKCPHRWRMTFQKNETMPGAFYGWKVVVFSDDHSKQETYTNILKSGGAKIVPYPTPKSILLEVTHVIVESKKSQVDLNPYLSNKIKCLKPDYLAYYLLNDPPPSVDDFLYSETKDSSGNESSHKKRNSSATTRLSKRTRLK